MNIWKNRVLFLRVAACFMLALVVENGWAAAGESGETVVFDSHASNTLKSITKVGNEDNDFFQMDYTADYGLEALMVNGAESQETLNHFISERLLNGLPFYHDTLRMACSTFSATLASGDFIQGRNMDFAGAQNIIVRTQPKNGYKSLSMVCGWPLGYIDKMPAGLLGRAFMLAAPYYLTDGINEKGLSVALLLLQDTPVNQETGKTPIVTLVAMRLMLDRAATVDEAIALLQQYDMHSIYGSNYHYHVADAQGKSAVIEYVDNQMQVIFPEGYGQVATNFFLSPDKIDLLDDGKDRSPKLQAVLDEGKGIITQEKAWQMLNSVVAVHDYDELTNIEFNTAYSIIYNNTKRTMDVCMGTNFDVVYSYKVDGEF